MVGGWLFYISFLSRSFFLSRLRFKALKLSWPGSAGGGGSGKREGRKRRRKKKRPGLGTDASTSDREKGDAAAYREEHSDRRSESQEESGLNFCSGYLLLLPSPLPLPLLFYIFFSSLPLLTPTDFSLSIFAFSPSKSAHCYSPHLTNHHSLLR